MNKISVSSPGKLMLFGEHAAVYGKACIVTAINQRLTVHISQTEDDHVQVTASDVGVKNYSKSISELGHGDIPKEARFVEIAIKNFFTHHKISSGLLIATHSDFTSQFGFGSSSAVTVCVLKGLSELFHIPITVEELFHIAFQTVLDIQKKGSGFDVAAAIWGGTLFYVKGGSIIRPIEMNSLPIIIGYTGIKADTVTLMKKVSDLKKHDPLLVNSVFERIENITHQAEVALHEEEWEKVGVLMNENQNLLKRDLEVSTNELDRLIESAKSAGAYGAKLSGAGGGDCMIAIGNPEKRDTIERAIESAGGIVMNVTPNAQGVSLTI